MKKIFVVIITVAIMLSLSACDFRKTEEVTIDTDNWSEYFEVYKVEKWNEDGFGGASFLQYGYAIKLKDEYIDKVKIFKNVEDCDRVSFRLRYKSANYMATFDWDNCEYNLGKTPVNKDKHYEEITYTYRMQNKDESDFPAFISSSVAKHSYQKYAQVYMFDNMEVIEAKGTIHLYID